MTACGSYQTGCNPGGVNLTERALELAGVEPGMHLAEIGCGSGAIVTWLRERRGVDAIGIDLRRLAGLSGLPLLQADAASLPLASGTLDVVLAECSLSLVHQLPSALAECARVLAPAGRLIITDVYSRNPDAPGHLLVRDRLAHELQTAGFRLRIWEDHSYVLKEYLFRMLMADGPAEDFCAFAGDWRKTRPGYFLLIADTKGDRDDL